MNASLKRALVGTAMLAGFVGSYGAVTLASAPAAAAEDGTPDFSNPRLLGLAIVQDKLYYVYQAAHGALVFVPV